MKKLQKTDWAAAAYICVILALSLIPGDALGTSVSLNDKLLHMVMFAGLGFLVSFSAKEHGYALALCTIGATAIVSEGLQMFVPGRDADPADCGFNIIGGILMMCIISAVQACRRKRCLALVFLAFLLAFRILFAWMLPITGDEAYFVQWALHPDLCYYDHPGMVGWIMYPFITLFGRSVISARFQSVCAGLVFAALAFFLGRRMYPGTKVPFKAMVIASIVPIAAVLSVLVSTDTPLAVFWTCALASFYAACEKNRLGMWVLTGILIGCAFLSKFIAFGFVPAAFLYLVLVPENRHLLKAPGPWIALGTACVLFFPVVVWNYQHDWLTFTFNFVRRQGDLGFSFRTFFSYAGGQLLLFSPFAILVPLVWLARNMRAFLKSRNEMFLILFAGVPLGGFVLISLARPVGGHWASVALVPLALLCGAALEQYGRKLAGITVVTAAFLSALPAAGAAAVLGLGPEKFEHMAETYTDISREKSEWYTGIVFGSTGIAEVAETLKTKHNGFLATGSYSLSSVLTFYSPKGSHYCVWGSRSFYGRNYDLWDDPGAHKGQTMVFAGFARRTDKGFIQAIAPYFSSITAYCFSGAPAEFCAKHLYGPRISVVCIEAPAELRAYVIIVGKQFSGEELSYETD